MTNLILPLNSTHITLETVGGKGASLARLVAAGLPVPPGFHVTTTAYRCFVRENGLQEKILAAVTTVEADQPAVLEEASCAIRRLFAQGAMPEDIAEAIRLAYADLGGSDLPVVVRSSATAEDLPGLSFAGQQETFLNVRSWQAVLEAVKQCWASLWTARAIAYRIQHGIDQESVALAVVVQVLVAAEAAGVMFTANAVNGRRDEVVINAAWGLGEAIVGGRVTPDTLTLDKASGRVLSRDTADKHVMTVPGDGGTREQPTPDSLRRAPVLEDDAATDLARLGVQIERMYGEPMDIEWARADGRFAILQARPITTLPQLEAPLPTEWPLPGKGPFFRGSIVDFLPDPLSPLFATLGRDHYNESMKQVMQWFIGDPNARMTWLDVINGYAYMSMALSPGNLLRLLLAVPRFPRLIRESVSRWRDTVVPRYTETVAGWRARRLSELSAAELLGGGREIYDEAIGHLTTLQAGLLGGAGATESMLKNVYNLLVRRPGDPAEATLVLGFDCVPVRAQQALYDLGCWVSGQGGLADYVRRRPTPKLAADLTGSEPPAGVDLGIWRELQSRWQAHLDQYGAMIYTLDFAQPLPLDEPAPLLETLRLYLNGQVANPYERQQELAGRREAAVQSVLGRLKGLRRKIFTAVLGWAQAMAPLREDAIAFVGHGYPQLRRMLKELGGRMAQAGAIDQPADIFWLTESEVEEATAALDRGDSLAARQAAVRQRQAEWRAQKRLIPPPTLPPTERFFLGRANMGGLLTSRAGAQTTNTIKGIPVSSGRVTAPACVLRGPEDFDQMQAGHVLVAEITTPAWTPLFAMAAAVVTDIGGPLSHGSIVAREYGIPAVMGTGVATRRIGSGQVITVDGDAGTVKLKDLRE
ncbi:MAG TPA: PEP/pyruvate-binding domain-containing protein [Aggregatilineaceae bacterium]|nr:PEP/pyruvate-binding domain-containing protein [Aggregatilineaceae bacterium]